jgi:hypothetical protein
MGKDDYLAAIGLMLALAFIAPAAAVSTPRRRGYVVPIACMGIAGFGGAAIYDHYRNPRIEQQYVKASKLEVLSEDRNKNGLDETYLKVNNEVYSVKEHQGKVVLEKK